MNRSGAIKIGSTLLQWGISAAVAYMAWEWLIAPRVNAAFFAHPGPVLARTWQWVLDGTALNMTRITLSESIGGFVIGSALGIVLALIIASLPAVIGKVFEPFVTVVYVAPKFVLLPILFIWAGTGLIPRAALVITAVFPVMIIYTLVGIRTVGTDQIVMMRLLGASRWQIAAKLFLPHVVGYVLTAMMFALPNSMFTAIGAEILFGTNDGLGGTMNTASELFNAVDVLAALVVATVVSAALLGVVSRLGARLISRRAQAIDRGGGSASPAERSGNRMVAYEA